MPKKELSPERQKMLAKYVVQKALERREQKLPYKERMAIALLAYKRLKQKPKEKSAQTPKK